MTPTITRTAGKHALGHRVLKRGNIESRYSVRIAESPEDIHEAQTLRFLVFNVELNEGLEDSYRTCRDSDRFDAVCDHLLVECGGEVVGTYRMQTGRVALENHGYYSGQEFDMAPFESVRDEMLELGRACIHRQHRNLVVLGLLWKEIAAYAQRHGCRYLVGCSSLTSRDSGEGVSAYRQLAEHCSTCAALTTLPLPGFECRHAAVADSAVRIPKLLAAYLSMGAKICAPPAIDREFGTIDFLTIMDMRALNGMGMG
jgi:putative hemolysin